MDTLKEKPKKNCSRADCPIRDVLVRVGDKWSMLIVDILGQYGTLRFSELNQKIGNISQKMLTVTLKTLEADGLIARKMYAQIPPKVEYCLTALGHSMLPSVTMLKAWATENMPVILASRAQYQQKAPVTE